MITYPINLPYRPRQRSITLTPVNIVGIAASEFTGAQQVQKHDGEYWQVDISMPPMTRNDGQIWDAFCTKLNGRLGTFLMGMDNAMRGLGDLSGNPVVNGDGQSGGTLNITGATPSIENWAHAGDYIQLGSGASSRLHKVLDNASTDDQGNASINIWPRLRRSPNDGDIVVVENTKGVFRLTDNISVSIQEANIYGFSFSAVEVI